MLAITVAPSSGSTFEIKAAFILRQLFVRAHCSKAKYIARGPKSEPPIPICTTAVKGSPAALQISPLCTLWAKSAMASI